MIRKVMIIILYAVAAVASFYLFLYLAFMSFGVVFSIVAAPLLLLWVVFCYLERKHQRELQKSTEGLDRLGSWGKLDR